MTLPVRLSSARWSVCHNFLKKLLKAYNFQIFCVKTFIFGMQLSHDKYDSKPKEFLFGIFPW